MLCRACYVQSRQARCFQCIERTTCASAQGETERPPQAGNCGKPGDQSWSCCVQAMNCLHVDKGCSLGEQLQGAKRVRSHGVLATGAAVCARPNKIHWPERAAWQHGSTTRDDSKTGCPHTKASLRNRCLFPRENRTSLESSR